MRWTISSLLRLLGFGLTWLGLSDASSDNFSYGIISAAAATALSLVLLPPAAPQFKLWPKRLVGTALLAGWFVQQSVIGGIDVARRAITPRIDVSPEIFDVGIDLPPGAGREVCYLLMNLLPGSMVQRVRETDDQTVAEIHTLSAELNPQQQWERLQTRVERAFQTGWLHDAVAE